MIDLEFLVRSRGVSRYFYIAMKSAGPWPQRLTPTTHGQICHAPIFHRNKRNDTNTPFSAVAVAARERRLAA